MGSLFLPNMIESIKLFIETSHCNNSISIAIRAFTLNNFMASSSNSLIEEVKVIIQRCSYLLIQKKKQASIPD